MSSIEPEYIGFDPNTVKQSFIETFNDPSGCKWDLLDYRVINRRLIEPGEITPYFVTRFYEGDDLYEVRIPGDTREYEWFYNGGLECDYYGYHRLTRDWKMFNCNQKI